MKHFVVLSYALGLSWRDVEVISRTSSPRDNDALSRDDFERESIAVVLCCSFVSGRSPRERRFALTVWLLLGLAALSDFSPLAPPLLVSHATEAFR